MPGWTWQSITKPRAGYIVKISQKKIRQFGKPLAHLLLSVPFIWLAVNWYFALGGQANDLGFNPQETTNRFSGDWAMRILLMSLAVTPVCRLFKLKWPMLFRRMLGLWAFFYAVVHVTSYVWLDMLFDWPELWRDILDRQYITVGMIALLMLIPLAVTSTKRMVKRLGARRWQKLHRSVYTIAVLVILHFFMMRKGVQVEPLIYAGILLSLLLLRFKFRRSKLFA